MRKIELTTSPVVFSESPHEYRLGDKKLSGITSLIKHVLGLGYKEDDLNSTKGYYIERAGEYGTSVHHAIEAYDTLGVHVTRHPKSERFRKNADDEVWEVSAELNSYIRHRGGFDPVANEYTVSDNLGYASNIDNVWLKRDTEGIWLVDTKTNNLNYYPGGVDALKEYLSWQLSIYAYLFEAQNPGLKVEGLACNWLRGEDAAFWTISRKSDEQAKALLSVPWVEIDGRIIYDIASYDGALAPTAMAPIPKTEIVPMDVVQTIYDIEKQMRDLEALNKQMRQKLRQAMDDNDIRSWDSGLFKATIAADSTTRTFDVKRFQADHPDLYEQYTKSSVRKGGFTIRLKEE